MCWGAEDILGITPTSQLVNVQSIQGSQLAFAAILDNGRVVTWGDRGGSSSRVQHQLQNVKEIHATDYLFAALLENGSVVTWNYNSPKPLPQLRNVLQTKPAATGSLLLNQMDLSLLGVMPTVTTISPMCKSS